MKFSNSLESIPDKEIVSYKFKLLYFSKDIGYWTNYPDGDPSSPPFKGRFKLEPSGDFKEIDGQPTKNFVGVFNMFYKTIENAENEKYEPAIVIYKNIN